VADSEVVGPGGADEPQDAVGPGDLDDEAEVEARALLERLDPVEEISVRARLRGAVEQRGVASILIVMAPRWAGCGPPRRTT
jgi:hypothetical protein